jgi:ABC-2 type transport system permease protein
MLIPVFSAGLLETLSNDPKKTETLGYLNLWDHMEEFSRGVVDTRRIVYYLSTTVFFLYLTVVSLSAKKESP